MVEMPQEEKNSGRENKHHYRHCYIEAEISWANKKYWDSGCKIFFTLTRCEQTATQHFTNVGTITKSLEYLPTLIWGINILLHAVGITGFLPNVQFIYKAGLATTGYHG